MTIRRLPIGAPSANIKSRIGVAKLTRLAFDAADLGAVWNDLLTAIKTEPGNPAIVMDMSVVAQLWEILRRARNCKMVPWQSNGFIVRQRSAIVRDCVCLRLQARRMSAAISLLNFSLSKSDVELTTLYIVPGKPLPNPLPEHDVALVVLGNSDHMAATLEEMEDIVPAWPRPVLNHPSRIFELERDRFFELMCGAPGVVIPKTIRISRGILEAVGSGRRAVNTLLSDAEFPIIVRPVNSHAGHGLEKLDDTSSVVAYLAQTAEQEFFISRFVDYSSPDGLFRKYRIVFIDGRAYACHMAIADEWKVWYLNADMGRNPLKRAEEALFMQSFDDGFAARHAASFEAIVKGVGLDYFGIDCAETKDGKLLLFEAETAMIVHDMDPPDIYPYKVPQMQKLFAAFVAMLHRRGKSGQAEAA